MLSENLCLHTATNLSLHSCIFPCSHIYTSFIHISLTIQCFTQFLHTQSHNSLHSSFALQKLFQTALSLTHTLLHHSHTLYSLCFHSFTHSQFSHSAHTHVTHILHSSSFQRLTTQFNTVSFSSPLLLLSEPKFRQLSVTFSGPDSFSYHNIGHIIFLKLERLQ